MYEIYWLYRQHDDCYELRRKHLKRGKISQWLLGDDRIYQRTNGWAFNYRTNDTLYRVTVYNTVREAEDAIKKCTDWLAKNN